MKKFVKYFISALLVIGLAGCTDLDETLAGDITKDLSADGIDMDNDFPLVRLGEISLMGAEAKARQSGNWSDAEPDVNILRARAGVAAYNSNLTETEFFAERGREMFQETARRTDLIRFGRYNEAWWEKPVSEPFRNVFPIPQLFGLGSDWTQNPGY